MSEKNLDQKIIDRASHLLESPVAKEFSHYYRPCPFGGVDVYRILLMFDVTDPCLQHAIKKLLVAGGRTAGKSIEKDINEAIASLTRWKEMREEEKCPNCENGSGYNRRLGRDNDEIVENCQNHRPYTIKEEQR